MTELTNRAIAEALGWTDIHEVTYWHDDYYDVSEMTALAGRRPGGSDDDSLLPDFLHDANAALDALSALCKTWTLFHDNGSYWIVYPGRSSGIRAQVTPARAACEVIMELAQQREEG